MRWVTWAILIWVMTILQSTVGRMLMIDTSGMGRIGLDLLAPLAVFAAFYAASATDAVLIAMILGFSLDLTSSSAVGAETLIGPMALGYALAARLLFGMREALFRDRVMIRVVATLMFCLIAHGVWVTLQSILAWGGISWGQYFRMLLQSIGLAFYSTIPAIFLIQFMARFADWLLLSSAGRGRRLRR
jgi:hypothetical protein